jgi:hypothetical protein
MERDDFKRDNSIVSAFQFVLQHGVSFPGEVLTIGFVCFGLPLVIVAGLWSGGDTVSSIVNHPLFYAWFSFAGLSVKLKEGLKRGG